MVNDYEPTFSIGIPTYNRIELLKQTIQSILDQTWEDYEVIIVNDFIDKPLSFEDIGILDKRLKIINNINNLGEAANLNFILSQAKGKYFTWQFFDILLHTDGKPQHIFYNDHVNVFHTLPHNIHRS